MSKPINEQTLTGKTFTGRIPKVIIGISAFAIIGVLALVIAINYHLFPIHAAACPFSDGDANDSDGAANGSYTMLASASVPANPNPYDCSSLTSFVVPNGVTMTLEGNLVGDYAAIQFNDLVIESNGRISADEQGCIDPDDLLSIGYGPDTVTGSCTQTPTDYQTAGVYTGGGGHGGKGGIGTTSDYGGETYGSATAPLLYGSSGGGNISGLNGGSGGGVLRLVVSGTLTHNGIISANGGAGLGNYSSHAAGGGSGGSVYLTVGTLVGTTGIFLANGGDGGSGYSDGLGGHKGASGGGGRIAIEYSDDNLGLDSTKFLVAPGLPDGEATPGEFGTVYVKNITSNDVNIYHGFTFVDTDYSVNDWIVDSSATNIYCDQNIDPEATPAILASGHIVWEGEFFCTQPISSFNFTANDFDITDGAIQLVSGSMDLAITPGSTLTWYNAIVNSIDAATLGNQGSIFSLNNAVDLELTGNTSVSASQVLLMHLSNLNIDSSASINTNTKGCSDNIWGSNNGYGPDPNDSGNCSLTPDGYDTAKSYNGGGGHGGLGGSGNDNIYAGGQTYDNVFSPEYMGSSGASNLSSLYGGAGGGAVKLQVSDTFVFNGSISANGGSGAGNGTDQSSGGGSGGSIYVKTGNLVGTTGTFQAKGGAGGDGGGSWNAGGGGGGRIAVYYNNSTYNHDASDFDVSGGAGDETGWDGRQGTVYVEDEANNSVYIYHGFTVNDHTYSVRNWTVDSSAINTGDTDPDLLYTNIYCDHNLASNPNANFIINASDTIVWNGEFVCDQDMKSFVLNAGSDFDMTGLDSINGQAQIVLKSGNIDIDLPAGSISTWSNARVGIQNGVGSGEVGYQLTVNDSANLKLTNNTELFGNQVILTNLASLDIGSDASIVVDRQGCVGSATGNGYGPDDDGEEINRCDQDDSGAGNGDGNSGGGAGHGGAGGQDGSGVSLNSATYDAEDAPVLYGSSGGPGADPVLAGAGAGAGIIRLDVKGLLTHNGYLSANGGDPNPSGGWTGGGGSGGSIYLTTNEFAGIGNFSAIGGNGAIGNGASGGGGGGRVYYGYTNSNWSGNCDVSGGDGAPPGTTDLAEDGYEGSCIGELLDNPPTLDTVTLSSSSGAFSQSPSGPIVPPLEKGDVIYLDIKASDDIGVTSIRGTLNLSGLAPFDCQFLPLNTSVTCNLDNIYLADIDSGHHVIEIEVEDSAGQITLDTTSYYLDVGTQNNDYDHDGVPDAWDPCPDDMIQPSLLGYWGMDESFGNVAYNCVAQNHGSSSGGVFSNEDSQGGVVRNSYEFIGIDFGQVEVPSTPTLDTLHQNDFTLSTHFQTTGTTDQYFISKDSAWKIGMNPDGSVKFELGDCLPALSSTASFNDGDWHSLMIVGEVSDSNYDLRLYVDVHLVDQVNALSCTVPINSDPLIFGHGSGFFTGLLDNVALFNQALSEDQVLAYHQYGLIGKGYCAEPVCGDGIYDPNAEECDDGNTVSGDGCNNFCVAECLGNDQNYHTQGGTEVVSCSATDSSTCGGQQTNTCSAMGIWLEGTCNYASTNGDTCNDGLYCHTNETCLEGACTNATPRDCGSLTDQCNIGSCDENVDACVATPANEGLSCNDGAYCTTGETCTAGSCDGGSQIDCSGLDDQCNVGACNENSDVCETIPVADGTTCSDDEECTNGDACVSGACEAGTTPNPGPQCLAFWCGNGSLDHPDEQCDDANNASGDGCSATCQLETSSCEGTDNDADGYSTSESDAGLLCCVGGTIACFSGIDCNDEDVSINPGAVDNICGVDLNCNAVQTQVLVADQLLLKRENFFSGSGKDQTNWFDWWAIKNRWKKNGGTFSNDQAHIDNEEVALMDIDPSLPGEEMIIIDKTQGAQSMKVYSWNKTIGEWELAVTYNNTGITINEGSLKYEVAGGKFFANDDAHYMILKAEGFNKITKVYSWTGSAWSLVDTYNDDGLKIDSWAGHTGEVAFGEYEGNQSLIVKPKLSKVMKVYHWNNGTWNLVKTVNDDKARVGYSEVGLGNYQGATYEITDPDDLLDTDGDGFNTCEDLCPDEAGPDNGCPASVVVNTDLLNYQGRWRFHHEPVPSVTAYAVGKNCAESIVGESWDNFSRGIKENRNVEIQNIQSSCAITSCTTDVSGSCKLEIQNSDYIAFATNGPAGTPFLNNYQWVIYRQGFNLSTQEITFKWIKHGFTQNTAILPVFLAGQVLGSELNVIPSELMAQADPLELEAVGLPPDTEFIYPIVLEADEQWEANLSIVPPEGYEVVTSNNVTVDGPVTVVNVGLKSISEPVAYQPGFLNTLVSSANAQTINLGEGMALEVKAKHPSESVYKDQVVLVEETVNIAEPEDPIIIAQAIEKYINVTENNSVTQDQEARLVAQEAVQREALKQVMVQKDSPAISFWNKYLFVLIPVGLLALALVIYIAYRRKKQAKLNPVTNTKTSV